MQTQIGVDVNGLRVVSYLHRAGSDTLFMMIPGHNSDGNRGRFITLAKSLEARGFDTLRFSATRPSKSENVWEVTSITVEAAQAEATLRSLRSKYQRVIVMGHSQGGLICLHLAQQGLADGIVFLMSVFNPHHHVESKTHMLHTALEKVHQGEEPRISYPDGRTFVYTSAFFDDLDNYKPLESIKHLSCPLLFIAGTEDTTVLASEVQLGFDAAHTTKEFFTVPDTHNFSNETAVIIANEAISWLARLQS